MFSGQTRRVSQLLTDENVTLVSWIPIRVSDYLFQQVYIEFYYHSVAQPGGNCWAGEAIEEE